jgi:hypothetical protein
MLVIGINRLLVLFSLACVRSMTVRLCCCWHVACLVGEWPDWPCFFAVVLLVGFGVAIGLSRWLLVARLDL